MSEKKVKICLASSSGGHFEQLMMLAPLIEKYSGYIVTEKSGYDVKAGNIPVRYVLAINRTDKAFFLKFLIIPLTISLFGDIIYDSYICENTVFLSFYFLL